MHLKKTSAVINNLKKCMFLPKDFVTSSDSEFVAVAPKSTIKMIFLDVTDEAYKNLNDTI